MSGFRLLLLKGFWLKLAVISWWSLALGSYAWFLVQVAKLGDWHEYLAVVASFVMSGAGFNYITNLYRQDTPTFSFQFAVPPLLMSSGVILLLLAAITGHHGHWTAQTLSAVLAFAAVMIIVGGSATGPNVKL